MKRGRPRKIRPGKPEAPVDPLVLVLENAFVDYLEAAIEGGNAEDMEVIPAHDLGEPSDPWLAVHVAIAPGAGSRRFELVISIEANNSRWLPDDEDDLLRDIHAAFSIPLNPSAHPDDDTDADLYTDVLAALEGRTPGLRVMSLHDAKFPTLGNPAKNFQRLVYVGVLTSQPGH